MSSNFGKVEEEKAFNFTIKELYHGVKIVQIRRFFWSVFSRIQTYYGEIRISPYSVRMRGNTGQKKLRIWTLFTQCVINKNVVNIFIKALDVCSVSSIFNLYFAMS